MGKWETYKEYIHLQHSWIVSKGLVECAYKCFFINLSIDKRFLRSVWELNCIVYSCFYAGKRVNRCCGDL